LIREHLDKINWYMLSANPAIFRDTCVRGSSLYKLLEDLRW